MKQHVRSLAAAVVVEIGEITIGGKCSVSEAAVLRLALGLREERADADALAI